MLHCCHDQFVAKVHKDATKLLGNRGMKMARRNQAAGQAAKDNMKSSEIAKAAEGLWAALLSGSASVMIEQAAAAPARPAH